MTAPAALQKSVALGRLAALAAVMLALAAPALAQPSAPTDLPVRPQTAHTLLSVWLLIAAGFAYTAWRQQGETRQRCAIAAAAAALLGLAYVADGALGDTPDPAWLLTWKGVCIAAMVGLLIDDIRRKRAVDRNKPDLDRQRD